MSITDFIFARNNVYEAPWVIPHSFTTTSSGTLCCAWCGKDLSGATQVTYLNGNQACCDLCLRKAGGL
jgi:hypothetical protein